MPKQGEMDYFAALGEEELRFAKNKPFSDSLCGQILSDIGVIISLLPPPPGRLIDFGCGTGWTSCFFARRGYEVVGVDISPLAIECARQAGADMGLKNIEFIVSDYEHLRLENRFDHAVFFYSLHHSDDQAAALKTAYHCLKARGLCITCEPGRGHARQKPSLEAVEKFNVTERDMPPRTIIRAAQAAGFKAHATYPRLHALRRTASARIPFKGLRSSALVGELLFFLRIVRAWLFRNSGESIVVLTKEAPDSLSRAGLKARLAVTISESTVKRGEPFAADVSVKNTGPALWLPSNAAKGAVHLGCHLLDARGELLELDFHRENLTASDGRAIGPHESLAVRARIHPPAPGDYILEFDLVAEGVCWFKENGSPTVRLPVRVV